MAGRTPAEAVHNFVDPLQKAFSCVTDAVLTVRGGCDVGRLHAVSIGTEPGHAKLRGPRPLILEIVHHYRVVEDDTIRGPYKVSTSGYVYELKIPEGPRVVAYRWHPSEPGGPPFPHMHVGPGTGAEKAFDRSHFPTGRISLEQVLRLAITDFDVETRRVDWADVLDASQADYEEWRIWSTQPPPPSE